MTKICKVCGCEKACSEFYKHSGHVDGLQSSCKACDKARVLSYSRTKVGLCHKVFHDQVKNSKRRGHVLPDYSLEVFVTAMMSVPVFEKLYKAWVASGYEKDLCPSPDRLDDYKPYTLDNLRLVTWERNRKKHDRDRKAGINNKNNTAINQYGLDNVLLHTYHSMREAARRTGCSQGSISRTCAGAMRACGGYLWQYA